MARNDVADADLLTAVAARDEGALKQLYDRHAAWMAARLRRRCADPEIVADVLQDTFVAAWGSARRFRGEGEVAAWLWGIAIHRLLSRLRKKSTQVAMFGPALLIDRDATDMSAEEQVLLTLEHTDLGAALGRISPELRVVMQVTVLDGLTTREAARLLGIPEGTVKTRLVRARARLREELG